MLKAQKKLAMNRPKPVVVEEVDAVPVAPEPMEVSPLERAQFLLLKYRKVLLGMLAAIVLLGVAIAAFAWWRNTQDEEARLALAKVERIYGEGDYIRALQGDTTINAVGLRTIADQYGSTASGNMATFYTARAYQQLDSLDLALQYYDKVGTDNNFLKAAVSVNRAAILESQGDYRRAAEFYVTAAERIPGDLVAPGYYLSAARAYQLAGDRKEAVSFYQKIKTDFPRSRAASEVNRYLAELNEFGQN